MLRGGQSLGSSDRGHLHTMECPVHPAGQWVGVRFVPVASVSSVPSVRGRRRCGQVRSCSLLPRSALAPHARPAGALLAHSEKGDIAALPLYCNTQRVVRCGHPFLPLVSIKTTVTYYIKIIDFVQGFMEYSYSNLGLLAHFVTRALTV